MKKNILKILALALITLNLSTGVVFAEIQGNAAKFHQSTIPKPNTLPGPTLETVDNPQNDSLRLVLIEQILPKFAVILIASTASLSLVFLVIAGVRFATAYGNDESVQKAKKQAIYSLVGLFVSLMAYTIVAIVSNFKYDEFSPAGTTPGPIHNETPGADLPQKNPDTSSANA